MTSVEFGLLVEKVCLRLKDISCNEPQYIASCKSGDDFELCVVRAVNDVLNTENIDAIVHHTPGSHAFPDIVVEFPGEENYGIEVKSSSSKTSKNWKINGNSVLGGTRKKVLDTYIIFGKTALGHQAFRFRRYEDAIANVAVTHSPRYFIDMEVSEEETFFAKSGLSYKQISEAAEPIQLITSYFKAQGQRAWWLAESTPAAIRMFSDISAREQNEIIAYCLVHFPEVFSHSRQKFSRSAMWMATDQGVLSSSLRDNFTAGGRCHVRLNDKTYVNLPHVFDTLHEHRRAFIRELEDTPVEKLKEDWNYPGDLKENITDKLFVWIDIVRGFINKKDIAPYKRRELLKDICLDK